MKIIQFYDENTKNIEELTRPNMEIYCETNGFDLLRIECDPYFAEKKIEVAREHLKEDVWLLDLDVFIKDNRTNIYNLISDKPINICHAKEDPKYFHEVNCGSIFLRKGCEDLLDIWYFHILSQDPSIISDQGAMWKTLSRNPQFKEIVDVHYYNLFNHNGPFLHHFCVPNKYNLMVTENSKWLYTDRFAQIFRYLSDKHMKHDYGQLYNQLLDKVFSVLEIGNLHGGGLVGFSLYYNTDDVEGVDVSPHKNKSKFKVYEGDSKVFVPDRHYDLIVDDGDHRITSQIDTWKNLNTYADVAYVIEDINYQHVNQIKDLGFEVMKTAKRPDSNIGIMWK